MMHLDQTCTSPIEVWDTERMRRLLGEPRVEGDGRGDGTVPEWRWRRVMWRMLGKGAGGG